MLLHLPGVKASLLDGISIQSMIKSEKLTPSGQIMGQKGAECHKGTIRVPDALQLRICNNTRGIRETGGHIKLFSPAQSITNESNPSEPGFQNLELNLGSFAFK